MGNPDNQQAAQLLEPQQFLRLIAEISRYDNDQATLDQFVEFLRVRILSRLGSVNADIYFRDDPGGFEFWPYHRQSLEVKSSSAVPPYLRANGPELAGLLQIGQSVSLQNQVMLPDFLTVTGNSRHAFFPVIARENITGLLYVGSRNDAPFPETYLEGVRTLAVLVGSRLASLGVIANLRGSVAAVEYSERLRKVLYEISDLSNNAASMEDLYISLHKVVGRFIFARNFFIALRVFHGTEQYIQYVYYSDEFDSFIQGTEIKVDPKEKKTMAGYLLASGVPLLLTPDTFDAFCLANDLSPLGTKAYSLVGAPFFLESLAGVVLVQSYREVLYSEQDKELLVFVARHIGEALWRKKAIDDLRDVNQVLSHFLRNSPIYVFIKEVSEARSRVLYASANLEKLLGQQGKGIVGKAMVDLFPPEIAEKITKDDWSVVTSGLSLQEEECLFGRTYTTIKFPITSSGKKMLAGYSIDITDRNHMEEALRDSEQRYRIIFEKAPLAVISFSSDGTIVDFNDKFVEIMGSTKEKLLGFNTAQKSSPKMRATIKKALEGEIASFEDVYTSVTGGKTTYLRGIFSPVTPGKNPTEVIATLEDISERKRHEQEQQKIEKLESLGVLAGGIAHDFNNILTGILGNISFAKVLVGAEHRVAQPLDRAEKAARRAAQLAQQLLTFSRGGEPNKKVMSLKSLVDEVLSLVLRGSNIETRVDMPPSLHAIHADEGQMSQALHNIVINAKQAMPGGGVLTISAENSQLPEDNIFGLSPGWYIKMMLQDEGCGISLENQQKIFDPYFSTKVDGTGLGLASTYSIIQRHNGYIMVNSVLGEGTVFTIFLPSIGVMYAEHVDNIQRLAVPGKGGRVLVMDDEEMIRDIAREMLEHLGYPVVTCASGEEAVALFKNAQEAGNPFWAVIMDLTIPGGLGGKETAPRMLAISTDVHLIVSSGYSSDPVMASFGKFGFCGAIAKPYSLADFQRVLGALPEQ